MDEPSNTERSSNEGCVKHQYPQSVGIVKTAGNNWSYTSSLLRRLKDLGGRAKGIDALAKAREHYEDGNSCGDAIAKALECFRTNDGLDTKALARCLKENEIEAPKVDMDRHGAIGRFRMCAGLMLRSVARKNGFVVLNGEKITAPSAKKRRRKLQ